jgi:hypothetical protein
MSLFAQTGNPVSTISVYGFITSIIRILIIILTSFIGEVKSDAFILSFKRIAVIGGISCLLLLSITWNYCGFFLDEVFYPHWRNTFISKPVFIIGNARSGTTYLHRAMAEDNRFCSFRTWELLFGLSITFHKLILFLYYMDGLLGSYLSRLISNIETLLCGHVAIHRIGLNEFEEDEWLMAQTGWCQLLLMMFPLADNLLG